MVSWFTDSKLTNSQFVHFSRLSSIFRSILDYSILAVNQNLEQLNRLRMLLTEIQNESGERFQNECQNSLQKFLQCLRKMLIFIKFLMMLDNWTGGLLAWLMVFLALIDIVFSQICILFKSLIFNYRFNARIVLRNFSPFKHRFPSLWNWMDFFLNIFWYGAIDRSFGTIDVHFRATVTQASHTVPVHTENTTQVFIQLIQNKVINVKQFEFGSFIPEIQGFLANIFCVLSNYTSFSKHVHQGVK